MPWWNSIRLCYCCIYLLWLVFELDIGKRWAKFEWSYFWDKSTANFAVTSNDGFLHDFFYFSTGRSNTFHDFLDTEVASLAFLPWLLAIWAFVAHIVASKPETAQCRVKTWNARKTSLRTVRAGSYREVAESAVRSCCHQKNTDCCLEMVMFWDILLNRFCDLSCMFFRIVGVKKLRLLKSIRQPVSQSRINRSETQEARRSKLPRKLHAALWVADISMVWSRFEHGRWFPWMSMGWWWSGSHIEAFLHSFLLVTRKRCQACWIHAMAVNGCPSCVGDIRPRRAVACGSTSGPARTAVGWSQDVIYAVHFWKIP